MEEHYGHKARIMDLPAMHPIVIYQATPYEMNLFIIRQKSEGALYKS